MLMAWLTLLNSISGPLVSLMLQLLYQFKIIKTKEELAKIQQEFDAAIQKADEVKDDPVDAQRQYNDAKKAAEDQWKKNFGQ